MINLINKIFKSFLKKNYHKDDPVKSKEQMTIKQHYVPQSYLSLWYDLKSEDKEGEFNFYDIIKKRTIPLKGKKSVPIAFEKYFYEDDKNNPNNINEKWFHVGEVQLGSLFNYIKKNISFEPDEDFSRKLIKGFLAMPYRTKFQVEYFLSIYNTREEALTNMKNLIEKVSSKYDKCKLIDLNFENSRSEYFITCDSPLIDFSTMIDNRPMSIIPVGKKRVLFLVDYKCEIYKLLNFDKCEIVFNTESLTYLKVNVSSLDEKQINILNKMADEVNKNIILRARLWAIFPTEIIDLKKFTDELTTEKINRRNESNRELIMFTIKH